jgi:ABC-type glutathione transport system ATPase component
MSDRLEGTYSSKRASAKPGEPVLSVRGLTTSFLTDGTWKTVVRDVSFDVMPGETVAIVGESGSGKSVTSLSIMRLLAKGSSRIEGKIVLNGKDILSLSDREMRQVRGNDAAMIFQEPMTSLNPVFTIGRQISEALTCHGDITKAAARVETVRLLERVRIPTPPLASRTIRTSSRAACGSA